MINLMLGDCLERMKEIPDGSVDMVLADPPYGTTQCKWDSVIPFDLMWQQLKRVIKPNGAIVMTASQPFTSIIITSNLGMFKQSIVWNKKMPTGVLNAKKKILVSHEDIVLFSSAKFGNFTYNPQMTKGKMRRKNNPIKTDTVGGSREPSVEVWNDDYYPKSILEVSNANQKGKQHPTQKPVALMEYLIKTYTNENETVLDFVMGSGTTGVACKNLNRKFIGIEKDETYFKIAQDRIAAI